MRHFIMNNFVQTLVSSRWNEFVLGQFQELVRIHGPCVWMEVSLQFSSNSWVIKKWFHLHVVPPLRLVQFPFLHPDFSPNLHLMSSPIWCKLLTPCCPFTSFLIWPLVSAQDLHSRKYSIAWVCLICNLFWPGTHFVFADVSNFLILVCAYSSLFTFSTQSAFLWSQYDTSSFFCFSGWTWDSNANGCWVSSLAWWTGMWELVFLMVECWTVRGVGQVQALNLAQMVPLVQRLCASLKSEGLACWISVNWYSE